MPCFLKSHWEPILSFITTVLWGIYIYYTIRTFKEIKKQTELQSEAFLVAVIKQEEHLPKYRNLPEIATTLFNKWKSILENNIPLAIQAEKYIILTLTNRGRSDIIQWNIKVKSIIESSKYLSKDYNTSGEITEWSVKYSSSKDIIEPGDSIDIPIAVTGNFPKNNLSWTINYSDIRDIKYSRFGGDESFIDTNALTEPSSEKSS